MSNSEIICRKCRNLMGEKKPRVRQSAGWCTGCHRVVQGTICDVPTWVIAIVAVLAVRLHI